MWKEKKGADLRRAITAKAKKEAAGNKPPEAKKEAAKARAAKKREEEAEKRTEATAAKHPVAKKEAAAAKPPAPKKKAAVAKAPVMVVVREESLQDRRMDDQEAESRMSRAAKKREEVSQRRAANRKLAEQEEEELEKNLLSKKLGREKVDKVSKAELERQREEEQEAIRRKIEEKNSRTTTEEEYKKIVHVKNTNKEELAIDAHTIDGAINQLHIGDDHMKDSKVKALFKAFGEEQLLKMKKEKPGLSDSQYKNLMLKLWKRSGYVGDQKVSLVSNAQKNKNRDERKARGKTLIVLESC